MSISVADPTRLPTASLDAEYRLSEFNSRKLPGQTWIPIGKRKLPTVVRAVGTPTGIIYASPGKQPPGLSVPATTAQLQATCYFGNAKGVYLQAPGEWWIYLDSATAENIVVYDDISTPAILQSLGISVVGGSSGLSADVGNTDADADFAKANNALSVRGNIALYDPVSAADWLRALGITANNVESTARLITGSAGGVPLATVSALIGRDLTGGGTGVSRQLEARAFNDMHGAAGTLAGLLTGAGILATRLSSGVLRRVHGEDNDPTLATMFGTNASPMNGLNVNARQRWADLCEEATAAAGSGVTLTLPAPAANLRQHIVGIEISKFAAAALIAAATPKLVTSTNTVGTPAWTFPQGAEAQGTIVVRQVFPSHVIRASAAATAVTIVAPATTDVIWKITCFYYNA